MHEDEQLEDQISRYIHHTMEAPELAQFEARLAADPPLKKEVEQLQQLKKYYNKDLVDFTQSLQEAGVRYRQKNSTPAKINARLLGSLSRKWFLLAAAIIVIAGAWWMLANNEDPLLAAKQDSLDGLNKSLARKGDSIAVADLLFYAGRYNDYLEKAIHLLEENPASEDRNILNINICKSYIQLNQPARVISFYQSLSAEERQYCYLQYQAALAYTLLENKKQAIGLFKLVEEQGCFPVDVKAAEWIKKLEKN